jgi:signal transduction histidine kinase
LLDVAKINSGKLTFQFEEFNFSQMINEVVTRFQDQFKLVECLVEVISDDSVVIFGDTFRLEQVIINLITNSLKYGAGKPILISVFQDDHFAYLKIRDFGIGIPKEKQHLIFNRFERVVSDQNISGLGLGLYIAHQIVETHKGKIEVESDTNKGATFTVRIPISLA